jgi:hypothetical protein
LAGEEVVHVVWQVIAIFSGTTHLQQAGQRSMVDDIEHIRGPVSLGSVADDRAQQARKDKRLSR